jgi:phage tail sheath gpL-like
MAVPASLVVDTYIKHSPELSNVHDGSVADPADDDDGSVTPTIATFTVSPAATATGVVMVTVVLLTLTAYAVPLTVLVLSVTVYAVLDDGQDVPVGAVRII